MRVEAVSDGVILTATGAEVDALYRAYLEAYGPEDAATQDAFASVFNRLSEHREWIGLAELEVAASVLEDEGMEVTAHRLRTGWFAWAH